jgi:hypothetical protein
VAEWENDQNVCCGIGTRRGDLRIKDDAETRSFKPYKRKVQGTDNRFRDETR